MSPKALIFSALISDEIKGHERHVERYGFVAETRNYSDNPGHLSKYDCVIAVKDHAGMTAVHAVIDAAKRSGLPAFTVTKKKSHDSWLAWQRWAEVFSKKAASGVTVETKAPSGPEVRVSSDLHEWMALAESVSNDLSNCMSAKGELERERDVLRDGLEHARNERDRIRSEGLEYARQARASKEEAEALRATRDAQAMTIRDLRAQLKQANDTITTLRADLHRAENQLESPPEPLKETPSPLTRLVVPKPKAKAKSAKDTIRGLVGAGFSVEEALELAGLP